MRIKQKRVKFRPILIAAVWLLGLGATNSLTAEPAMLDWNPNAEPDIAGYRIYQGTASRSYNRTIDVGNSTNAVVTNLQSGITYFFAVTAYNTSKLESDYSNEASYTPGAVSPQIVEVAQSGYGVLVTWTSEPGARYRVQMKTSFVDPHWLTISEEILPADELTSWADTSAFGGARFYRVELLASDGFYGELWDRRLKAIPFSGYFILSANILVGRVEIGRKMILVECAFFPFFR